MKTILLKVLLLVCCCIGSLTTFSQQPCNSDLTTPRIRCKNMLVNAEPGQPGSIIDLKVATDDSEARLDFQPASGSFFPIGKTEVLAIATDPCGNQSTCKINVTVKGDKRLAREFVAQQHTPEGLFDEVFDRFGTSYQLRDLEVQRNGQLLCSNTGYFKLYFAPGSGMEGNSPVEVARRDVLCQLFSDLSEFITPVNPATPVNILVENIAAFSPPPGVLGVATSFYSVPAASQGGITDNQIWRTINSGVDAYTGVSTPIINSGVNSNGFYHGVMAFNFGGINWQTDLSALAASGRYDLYTVALHETVHALGIASLINQNGASKFGAAFPYYSRYDLFLETQTGQPLISNSTGCSLYNYQFNPILDIEVLHPDGPPCAADFTDCTNALQFAGSIQQAVYTPPCWSGGSSLSHLEDLCHQPTAYPNNQYYVMSNAVGTGPVFTKRFLKTEERQILCDLGFQVSNTYGNSAQHSLINYPEADCPGIGVAGTNDGITSQGTYAYLIDVGTSINITDILSNDHNASSFVCLEVLSGNGTVSTTAGTSFTFSHTGTEGGIILLRYIPVSPVGDKGNITYVLIYVVGSSGCVPSVCNMINNGGFEEGLQEGHLYQGTYQQGTIACWYQLCNSPNVFKRGATNQFGIPAQFSSSNPLTDSWDADPANKGFVGFWSSISPNNKKIEAIHSILNTPLIPGESYTMEFYAKVGRNINYSNNPYDAPAKLLIGGSENFLATVNEGDFIDMVENTGDIPVLSTIILDNTGEWEHYSINFTYTGSNPLHQIILANYPMGLPESDKKRYFYLDELSLVPEEGTVSFSPPSDLCYFDSPVDLSAFATPPGGIFSGPGVTGTSFDPTAAGIGTHSITYTYTNALGCELSATADITVTNADTCQDCCELTTVTAVPVSDDPCCFRLQLENYCDSLTGVYLQGIAGVNFANNFIANGWTATYTGNDHILLTPEPAGSFVPTGSVVLLGTYCLTDFSGSPQEVEVGFVDNNNEITDCKRQVRMECPVIQEPICNSLGKASLKCDPLTGDYTFSFLVMNNSGFDANQVELLPTNPSAYVIPPIAASIPDQSWSTALTVTIPASQLVNESTFCLRVKLAYVVDGVELYCCTNPEVYCFNVPVCGCVCGNWQSINLIDQETQEEKALSCGIGIPVVCNRDYQLLAEYLCLGPCDAKYFYNLDGPEGATLGTATNLLDLGLNFSTPGVYTLTITVACGKKKCEQCIITFKVDGCEKDCTCGTYEGLIIKTQDGSQYPTSCGDQPVMLDCFTGFLQIRGLFSCEGACDEQPINWMLIPPNGNGGPVFGSVTGSPFYVTLMPNQISEPGLYTLTLIGECGENKCPCRIQFVIRDCDERCDCNKLQDAVNEGFGVGIPGWPVFNCKKRSFTPYGLDLVCDQVKWSVNGVVVGNTSGNNTFMYTFPSAGIYEVCMNVVRIEGPGEICETRYCRKIRVFCKKPAGNGGDIGRLACPESLLSNGSFTEGIQAGVLGEMGQATDWHALSGEPIINNGPGYMENGSILLEANATQLATPITINKGRNLLLSFAHRIPEELNTCRENPSTSMWLEIRAAESKHTNAPSWVVGRYELSKSSSAWQYISGIRLATAKEKLDGNLWLSFALVSNPGYCQRFIELDALCVIEESVGTNDQFHSNNAETGVFPNPTTDQLTIRFDPANLDGGMVELIDMRGKLVRSLFIAEGKVSETISLSDLPPGMYVVRIRQTDQPQQLFKVVKQ